MTAGALLRILSSRCWMGRRPLFLRLLPPQNIWHSCATRFFKELPPFFLKRKYHLYFFSVLAPLVPSPSGPSCECFLFEPIMLCLLYSVRWVPYKGFFRRRFCLQWSKNVFSSLLWSKHGNTYPFLPLDFFFHTEKSPVAPQIIALGFLPHFSETPHPQPPPPQKLIFFLHSRPFLVNRFAFPLSRRNQCLILKNLLRGFPLVLNMRKTRPLPTVLPLFVTGCTPPLGNLFCSGL